MAKRVKGFHVDKSDADVFGGLSSFRNTPTLDFESLYSRFRDCPAKIPTLLNFAYQASLLVDGFDRRECMRIVLFRNLGHMFNELAFTDDKLVPGQVTIKTLLGKSFWTDLCVLTGHTGVPPDLVADAHRLLNVVERNEVCSFILHSVSS